MYPIKISVDAGADLMSRVRAVKDLRGRVPNDGLSFGLLRYLADGDVERSEWSSGDSDILFNA